MSRPVIHSHVSDTDLDDRSLTGVEALPARFAETLETLRTTRAQVTRMRGIVRAATALGRGHLPAEVDPGRASDEGLGA